MVINGFLLALLYTHSPVCRMPCSFLPPPNSSRFFSFFFLSILSFFCSHHSRPPSPPPPQPPPPISPFSRTPRNKQSLTRPSDRIIGDGDGHGHWHEQHGLPRSMLD